MALHAPDVTVKIVQTVITVDGKPFAVYKGVKRPKDVNEIKAAKIIVLSFVGRDIDVWMLEDEGCLTELNRYYKECNPTDMQPNHHILKGTYDR